MNTAHMDKRFKATFSDDELPHLARHICNCCFDFGFFLTRQKGRNIKERVELFPGTTAPEYIIQRARRIKPGHTTDLWMHDRRNPSSTPIATIEIKRVTTGKGYDEFHVSIGCWNYTIDHTYDACG